MHRTPLWRVQPKSSAYDRAATSAGPGAANGYRLPARKQGVFDQRYCDANRIVGDAARGARYAALKRVVRTCGVAQCLPLRPRRLGGAPHCDASLPLLRAAPACMLAVAKLLAVQHMPPPAQACPEPGSVHAEQAGRAGCRMPLPCTLSCTLAQLRRRGRSQTQQASRLACPRWSAKDGLGTMRAAAPTAQVRGLI